MVSLARAEYPASSSAATARTTASPSGAVYSELLTLTDRTPTPCTPAGAFVTACTQCPRVKPWMVSLNDE
ncbi:MAG: hypothetical protein HRU70_11760 [Phycisphaeraceae bacterium]|nr:MAG: hypothetical protein HRU70_11760 [Phycisphaeraceae bacterium]